jgi:SufS family cysteine desulfurase
MTINNIPFGAADSVAPLATGLVPSDHLTAGRVDDSMLTQLVNQLYAGSEGPDLAQAGVPRSDMAPPPPPALGSMNIPDIGAADRVRPVHAIVAPEPGAVQNSGVPMAPPGMPSAAAPQPPLPAAPQLSHSAPGAPSGMSTTGHKSGMEPVHFTLPAEIQLLPEPANLFTALNPPDFPRDPPIPTSIAQPYWLEGRDLAKGVERDIEIVSFAPAEIDLLPTQVFANVPDKPPEKLPEKPPAKSFFINKAIAMGGQEVTVKQAADAKAAPPKPNEGLLPGGAPEMANPGFRTHSGPPQEAPDLSAASFYWARTASSTPHADRMTPSNLVEPAKPGQAALGPADGFHVDVVRKDFPILRQKVNGKPLVWLDNAATTQKPQAVIDRIAKFYQEENSNVHRAAHEMAARATDAYEAARQKVAKFLGAQSVREIVFTRGTTESINLVAQTYGKRFIETGDEIILLEYEHHSNIVPWQMIAQENGAVIRVAPITDTGEVNLEAYERLFNKRTRMVSLGHVSNALGTVAPIRDMIATAHRYGVKVLIDGAQSVPHFPINVRDLDADFFVMSGHKLFGPTGIGVLWAREELLAVMPPWQGGGNMIKDVTFKHTVYQEGPAKFEAGTGNLAGAVGLGAAIDYLDKIGFAAAALYEEELLKYAQGQLAAIRGVRMIGTAPHKAGVLSLITNKLTPAEIGVALNAEGIAVRVGHHCAQPALAHFGLRETVRPSVAFYNTHAEIDLLVRTIDKALHAAG